MKTMSTDGKYHGDWQKNHFALRVAAILSCCLTPFWWSAACGGDDLFRDRVVKVFQKRCLHCHSDKEQKGDFSLQSAASAFADGHIEVGDADASRLVELITPEDGKSQMPKKGEPLSEAEIADIRNWIDRGAKWPRDLQIREPEVADLNWWSLEPLTRPAIPSIADRNTNKQSSGQSDPAEHRNRFQIRNPIDSFIYENHAKLGLVPTPEASRRTLIRRLYFDLIGLPPTPEQVQAFVKNDDPNSYEQLVDQLLASKHYGERWARHWLDVAHYADTHGYDKDKPRPNAWPYRDYVIRAFNTDRPYARFVSEQIAGDVLWPNSRNGIVATGFLAAGPWDFIGHAEVPETKIDGRVARNMDRDDMVTSTMNSFCSATVQCARCHHHKFDPIKQEHYYSLQAVFAALDRADRLYDSDPKIADRREILKRRDTELRADKSELDAQIEKAIGAELKSIDARLAALEKQKEASTTKLEFGYHSLIERKQDVIKWVQVDLGKPTSIGSIVYIGCHDSFNGIGHGFGFPPRFKIEVSDSEDFSSGVTVVVNHVNEDMPNPGTQPQAAKLVTAVTARYVRMTATKLAHRKNDYIFAIAEIDIRSPNGENVAMGKSVSSLDSIEAPVRWQRKNLVDGYYFGVAAMPMVGSRIAKLKQARQSLLDEKLSDELRSRIEVNRLAIRDVSVSVKELPEQDRVYAGTVYTGAGNFVGTGANGGKPRPIHVLHRGDVLQPREQVEPGAIRVIKGSDWRFELPQSHHEGDRRAALAKWIVNKKNPLTWRSIVNRVWHYHFGRGIVATPNDFGRMGKLPTHPELLDWLAVEFRDNGQSIKTLNKLIVMSATYRQASRHNEANSRIDSDNAYLWRMNRRRLTAEEIRDSVLAISGKLDPTMYGSGFQLFVVERPEHSPHYEYHKHDPNDPKSHRRTIYRFIVRSQPDPFMATLDCADSSQSVPARDETQTALQALSLLNNKFMLRMAQHFSERLSRDSQPLSEQVQIAFQQATGRLPTEDQLRMLVRYASEYGTDNLCRLLFNLNEFVFVD